MALTNFAERDDMLVLKMGASGYLETNLLEDILSLTCVSKHPSFHATGVSVKETQEHL